MKDSGVPQLEIMGVNLHLVKESWEVILGSILTDSVYINLGFLDFSFVRALVLF